jgi:hypothetical protein
MSAMQNEKNIYILSAVMASCFYAAADDNYHP